MSYELQATSLEKLKAKRQKAGLYQGLLPFFICLYSSELVARSFFSVFPAVQRHIFDHVPRKSVGEALAHIGLGGVVQHERR